MHAKSGLRVVLKWKIFRPDSVIAVDYEVQGLSNGFLPVFFCVFFCEL